MTALRPSQSFRTICRWPESGHRFAEVRMARILDNLDCPLSEQRTNKADLDSVYHSPKREALFVDPV